MQTPTQSNTDDPAYRAAIEAAVLPLAARNSRALWRDAALIAHEEGAAEIGPRQLRQALALQYAIAAAIGEDPGWCGEAALARQHSKGRNRAERARS